MTGTREGAIGRAERYFDDGGFLADQTGEHLQVALQPDELLGDVGAFGQGSRGLLEIESVDLDPLAIRLHQWPSLSGQVRHLGGGEFEVVEQDGPCNLRQLVGAHHGTGRSFGEQAQRRMDEGQRRPQLVAGHRHELGPHALGLVALGEFYGNATPAAVAELAMSGRGHGRSGFRTGSPQTGHGT